MPMTVPMRGFERDRARGGVAPFLSAVFMAAVLLAAVFMALPGRVQAETVGIEAKGVSLWAALHNRRNFQLDVRDELNRPVSGRLIESQLKAASAAAAAESSYASRLPKVRAVVAALEMLAAAKLFLSPFSPHPQVPSVWALPVLSRPEPKAQLAAVFLCSLVLTAGLLTFKSAPQPLSLSSCQPLVLRC